MRDYRRLTVQSCPDIPEWCCFGVVSRDIVQPHFFYFTHSMPVITYCPTPFFLLHALHISQTKDVKTPGAYRPDRTPRSPQSAHAHTHTYIHTHTHAPIATHTHTHAPIPTHAHTHTHAPIPTHTHAHAHAHVHTPIPTHAHTHMHTHIRTYTYTRTCPRAWPRTRRTRGIGRDPTDTMSSEG